MVVADDPGDSRPSSGHETPQERHPPGVEGLGHFVAALEVNRVIRPTGGDPLHGGLADDDVRGLFGSANGSLPTSDTRCLRSRLATPIASATSTASSPSCTLDGTSRLMRWSSPRGNTLVGLSLVRHPGGLNCQEGPLEPTEGHPPQGALRCAGPPAMPERDDSVTTCWAPTDLPSTGSRLRPRQPSDWLTQHRCRHLLR
jgi:hypothetical protein